MHCLTVVWKRCREAALPICWPLLSCILPTLFAYHPYIFLHLYCYGASIYGTGIHRYSEIVNPSSTVGWIVYVHVVCCMHREEMCYFTLGYTSICHYLFLFTLPDRWVKTSICHHFATLSSIRLFISFLTYIPHADNVWFSLNGTTYQNNSCVALEDIGENYTALLCMTRLTSCCKAPHTKTGSALGEWYFPNGTEVLGTGNLGDFYRTRDEMVVRMHRRRGGVAGIYRCEIPDSANVTQTLYIEVYTAGTGEWYS